MSFDALPADHPLATGATADSALVAALEGRTPTHRPVWFMRQAGRSLPEYLKVREGTTMLESCLEPALAAEITLQPVRRYGVDAGIFFSDIVVPLKVAGVGVDIAPGVGPVFDHPIRTMADVDALPALGEPGDGSAVDLALDPIREAVRLTVAQLGSTPLIGFAGAPFTLAAYMVQGRPSRDHMAAREAHVVRAGCVGGARVVDLPRRGPIPASAGARGGIGRAGCLIPGRGRCPRPPTSRSAREARAPP
ncbi:hypothetical protein GCM10025876_11680 [Demequina litorisediminis]|uniref:Uroporphyrinogen decarboxylase (URO-D) domain-containing protein n=1 Tax=Demequina litorisediminis TaxID=1849022 RepID=A0ABQ6IE31_9MICO|nr:hypothetical protein GCM10025876_11680 [Demequina litorisediminis]